MTEIVERYSDDRMIIFDDSEETVLEEDARARMRTTEIILMIVGLLLLIAPVVLSVRTLRRDHDRIEEAVSAFVLALSAFVLIALILILLITFLSRSKSVLEARGVLAMTILAAGSMTLILLVFLLTGT